MINYLKYTAIALIAFASLSVTGCKTLQTSSSLNTLSSEKKEGAEMAEAAILARDLANQKRAEIKPLNEIEISVDLNEVSANTDPVWAFIQEQKIETSRPLALAELIDIALSNNPSSRQAWENIHLAKANKKQAESSLYPQITASAALSKERIIATNKEYNVNSLGYGPNINLTYLILDFGGRSAAIEQTSQLLFSASFEFNQSIQDLLLDVERSYYDLHSANSALEAAEDDAKNAKADFEAAERRFEVGLASKLEVLQAKSNYDDSLYTLEAAKGDVKSAKAALAKTIGVSADTPFEIAEPAKDIPTNIGEEEISRLIVEALDKKPEVSSMRANLRAKKAALKAADSDLWPKLNGSGATGMLWHNFPADQKTNEQEYGYSAKLSLDWDIFDGFYNINKKRAAEAELEAERQKLIQAEIEVSADVWTKYYAFNTATRKLVFSETFLDTAKTSYDLATEGYNAGLKSMLDLLQAQSKLSEARSKLIQSKKDLFIALAELAHATGSLHSNADTENNSRIKNYMEIGEKNGQ